MLLTLWATVGVGGWMGWTGRESESDGESDNEAALLNTLEMCSKMENNGL